MKFSVESMTSSMRARLGKANFRRSAVKTSNRRKRKGSRRSLHEILESLPLIAQFRVVVFVSVTVTLLVAQAAVAFWDAWQARQRPMDFARSLPAAVTAQLANGRGLQLPDGLAAHADLLAAGLKDPGGRILDEYIRSDADAGPDRSRIEDVLSEPASGADWSDRVLQAIGFEPRHLTLPVDLASFGTGSMEVLIHQRAIWDALGHRASELPFLLAVGCLIALLAANSLKRQVAEPLAQLASNTRVPSWDKGGQVPARPRRRNELTELAANFDALADRLAEYEKEMRNVRFASGRQIAERTRELEMRLRAAEALTRSKDDFLANMSHEIRTPMNGVLGMAELLAGTKLDRRQQRFVRSMRTAAETMMKIINDILDDSKIEAGKMELLREPFDVRELLEDVGQLYAGAAQTKKLELICRVEPSVPASIVGDALRLRQVLGNLVSNAVKYTTEGEVLLRVAGEPGTDGPCRLHFSVSDTGPGIPPEQHEAIFEAFKQLDNATRVGGTGLGLSIASRLVALMGGDRIDLTSQPGHGSSFAFTLPFEVAEAVRESDAAHEQLTGLRVLLVEDSATSYMSLEESLANWSTDVTVLNHGRLVPDRLRSAAVKKQPYDLVLLDHSLPDATTMELLRAIRLDPAISSTYVVLLSAFDFEPVYEGKTAIEPDMCLAKPVKQQLLKGALLAARSPRDMDRTDADARLAGAAAGHRSAALGLNVLVVDDNAVNREVAVAMLDECRCHVTVAEDGREAVSKAREQRFDAILMDCQMPGMDGYAATAAIRREESERGLAAVPIVALTANVLARDRSRCLAAGMNTFLAKPFTGAQLVGVLMPIAEERGTLKAAPPVEESLASPVGDGEAPLDDEPGTETEPFLDDEAVEDMLETPLFAPDEAAPVPVLDEDQIRAIRGLGKPQVLERLCELLFAQAPSALDVIDAAVDAGDLVTAADAAHSLKSAASNLGGRRLAAQLDRCETAAREENNLEVARNVARGLRRSYDALEAALKQEIQRGTGT
jgi:two-component system sensor histidine kinase/response regulator